MNTKNTPTGAAYRSLDEIRDQKDRLLDEIRRDDQQIKTLWGSLFTKPEPNFALTPSNASARWCRMVPPFSMASCSGGSSIGSSGRNGSFSAATTRVFFIRKARNH